MKYLLLVILLSSCTAVRFNAPYPVYYVRTKCIKLTDSTAYNPYTNECLILKDGKYHAN
jgi:hypothetical protein